MGQNNLVLVDTEDLKEMIHEAVVDAVNECLPGKNGVDCYSKNGHAVTVLTRQS